MVLSGHLVYQMYDLQLLWETLSQKQGFVYTFASVCEGLYSELQATKK